MVAVLVTGSTEGLGRSTATALLDQGHHVVVHARTRARLAAVQNLLDRGASAVVGDLAELRQVRDLAEQAEELGPYDAVVHNAGVMHGGLWPATPETPFPRDFRRHATSRQSNGPGRALPPPRPCHGPSW
ncbi:SDR family NAD(P)-dependent oxidoreductase [Streptomyces spiramenti]|uniref:SDR family NAD(P)-dependent oxidoreductase n=1 Tax=Streptomyces spiramenti TaxID=2720606 RepID=A0ABX1AD93_9ACTN|nr:SDR family NAD(P)-dependent oxidoreductase [Streptomyces spiramenti]NJP65182.1 SDR family NAD(P)-dependent oxidoreductase [Streptomyces spiramenti]